MNTTKTLISLIENICNYSSKELTEHEVELEHQSRFRIAMVEGDNLMLGDMAISYYNHKYLKDIYGPNYTYMQLRWKGVLGTPELADQLVVKANGTVVDLINTKPAWGRKEVQSLPHGVELNKEMLALNKTNLGTKDIIYLLFGIKSRVIGFTYYNEFVDMLKLQKTMISKKTAQELLRNFWENTKDDYKSNPLLFNIIKSVIISLNSQLKDSNSTQQLRLRFMEEFLILTTNV